MPVYVLKENMEYDELLKWAMFFEERPPGWREDDRMFKLIQTVRNMVQKDNTKPWDLFPSLAKIYNKSDSKAPMGKKLQGSALLSFILKSKDGEKLNAD